MLHEEAYGKRDGDTPDRKKNNIIRRLNDKL
jgi:hypothetical protein